MAGAGIMLGVGLSICNLPVVTVIGIGFGAGVFGSYLEDYLKEKWIGY